MNLKETYIKQLLMYLLIFSFDLNAQLYNLSNSNSFTSKNKNSNILLLNDQLTTVSNNYPILDVNVNLSKSIKDSINKTKRGNIINSIGVGFGSTLRLGLEYSIQHNIIFFKHFILKEQCGIIPYSPLWLPAYEAPWGRVLNLSVYAGYCSNYLKRCSSGLLFGVENQKGALNPHIIGENYGPLNSASISILYSINYKPNCKVPINVAFDLNFYRIYYEDYTNRYHIESNYDLKFNMILIYYFGKGNK